MKKIKYLFIALFLILVVDARSVFAVKLSSDELGTYLDEYNGAASSSAYVIGEYIFTDAMAIGTDDIMYAARTINVDGTDGTRSDASFKKMQIMEMYYDGEWKFNGYFSGKDPITEYNICYIDYVYICDADPEKFEVVFKNADEVLAIETLSAGTRVQMITDDLETEISKDGYTLMGWMNESTEEMVDENTVVDGNATYVMVWKPVPGEVTANIPDGEVGKSTEFTVSTVANGYAGKMVVGISNFSDPDAIAKLEYYEPQTGEWYELTGDAFGPATGFPMSDATSRFRVTWAKAGEYTFKMQIVDASDHSIVYSEVEETVSVAKGTALVTNETELLLALGNDQYTTIKLANNIEVSASIVVGRDILIDGNGNSLSKTGAPAYIPGGNNYVLKVYGPTTSINVNIKDVELTNAMAAIMVGDNADVTLTDVNVGGNVWGGIEVKDTPSTTLTVESITHEDEKYGKPTVWVDNATVENATIDFALEGSSWTVTEASVKGQVQYYLNADNAKGLVVTNEEELLAALATSDKVSLNGNIELTSALTLDKDVIINGNGNTISSNGVTTATLITINKDVNATLNDVVVDAKSELRAIKVVDGDLTIIGSTVKNGNASSYASGIFVTEEGNVTIENSIVTGNSAGESEPEEYYAKNSSDLWIGSEATGTIKSGTIGNVYVNDNIYGDGGILTVNGGTIDHVYLEYEDGAYATLNYVGGTIGRLSLATAPGVGFSAPNPVYGTYKSGAENRETIVASVATEDALLAALDNAWYDEVELTANVELSSALTLDRDVVIKGNGNELKAGEVSGSLITISDYANVTIDNVVVDANNELRAIKVTDANLIIKNSTVTGGNASSYASGVFVTEEGNVTIENSVITGNSAGVSEPTAYYAQYSSDLWIGSEATGTIKSGTIGNVYVNDNVYGNGGILTVENGTINAVYLEYEDGAYATLNYVGGEITSLLVSTLNGNGDYKTETPVVGQTYKSGVAAE